MPPRFDESAIARIVKRMREDYAPHRAKLRVRRLLLDLVAESFVPGNGTGTNIVPPFDKSRLIIQTIPGDISKAALEYKAIVAANSPKVKVANVLVDRNEATQKKDRTAAEEERVRQVMWDAAGGREKQGIVTYSQCWGRVGWYFTQRRMHAFGMPERIYYEADGLAPEELQALKDSGRVVPEPVERDGRMVYAESGTSYLDRRDRASKQHAVSARSLYTLDTFGPDVVTAAWDSDGVKWAEATLEVPAYEFGPGSEYAKAHHKYTGSTDDIEKYGLYYDAGQKRIVGGITRGGEPDVHQSKTWTYTIFATREEVYCLVSASQESVGTIVAYSEHDFGMCPFVPVPAYRTDSNRPGAQFASPMEKMFSEAPILAQLMTLSTLIAGYDGIPRWGIVRDDGSLAMDSKTGDPVVIASESAPALDPKEAEVIGGKPFLFQIGVDTIMKLVEFYAERFDEGKPNAAAVGGEGVAGSTAWGMRQMIEQTLATLKEPVENHAAAVAMVQRMWGHDLRCAAERGEIDTIYAFPVSKGKGRASQSLISFNPADFTDAFEVVQSADTAQSRIVKQQAGIERLASGTTTLRKVLEEFMEEDDPRQVETEIMAYDLARLALYGDTTKIQPTSVLYDFALALRGRISQKLMEMSPAYSIATAEQMATSAQQQFNASQQALLAPPGGGADMAGATGIVQPGMGMPLEQTGMPGGGQVPGLAPAPMVGAMA